VPVVSHACEADAELFRRELDGFIPDTIYDAHAHLWAKTHLPPTGWDTFREIDEEVLDLAAYRRRMAEMIPGRAIAGGVLLPGSVGASGAALAAQNDMIAHETSLEDGWRGSMLVTPGMEPDFIRQEVHRLGFSGLKCYHVQSGAQVTWDADIPEYLPETQVAVANEERLCITLHMVKARAVADPVNQYWIRRYCESYPNMQMILAHAARGFNAYHTIEGLPALAGLPNLWCDMAAISDPGACEAVIEVLGHERLLYGSDFPISHLRGRCVAVGDGFVWLYDDTLDWSSISFQPLQPVFVGLESLRVLKQAAWHQRLTDTQVEDVFCNNARRLFERLGS
jgi:predicted TIM-barrel fold metal-dependent hydrolase